MKTLHKKIKEYAKFVKEHGSKIDKLERIQTDFEYIEIAKIKEKKYPYAKECKLIDLKLFEIQQVFEYYFGIYNISGILTGYVWITGNENFKKLL